MVISMPPAPDIQGSRTQRTVPSAPAAPLPWHTLALEQIQARLGSGLNGLDTAEATARLVRCGANLLPGPVRRSLTAVILGQLRSPLIYLLLLAALVSLLLEEFGQAGFIALVLAINTTIGAVQEWRAEASSAALRKAIRTGARVVRSGTVLRLDSEETSPRLWSPSPMANIQKRSSLIFQEDPWSAGGGQDLMKKTDGWRVSWCAQADFTCAGLLL